MSLCGHINATNPLKVEFMFGAFQDKNQHKILFNYVNIQGTHLHQV